MRHPRAAHAEGGRHVEGDRSDGGGAGQFAVGGLFSSGGGVDSAVAPGSAAIAAGGAALEAPDGAGEDAAANSVLWLKSSSSRSAGRMKVSVSLACDFASSGTSKQVSYTISGSVTVVSDPLGVELLMTCTLPPLYTTSDLLPGSSDSYSSLGKKRTHYSVLVACGRNDRPKDEAIRILGKRIRTKEINNLACIQVKDQTTGRTKTASCIRVAEAAG